VLIAVQPIALVIWSLEWRLHQRDWPAFISDQLGIQMRANKQQTTERMARRPEPTARATLDFQQLALFRLFWVA
jgi:hypothetical protein